MAAVFASRTGDPGPWPEVSEGHRALALHAALDRESERLFGAIDAAVRFASPEDRSAVTSLFAMRSFSVLSRSRKRQLLESLEGHGAAVTAAASFRALETSDLDRAELASLVEIFANAPRTETWRALLRRFAVVVRRVPRPSRRVLCSSLLPPRPHAASFPGHAVTLGEWWASRVAELVGFLENIREVSADNLASFLYTQNIPIYALDSAAFPGALLLCFGEPSIAETHAYSRRVFLDEKRRLNVAIKSPVEAIRTGWRGQGDPRANELSYRKWLVSRAQERAIVEWLEREHVISGTGPSHEPKERPQSTFEAMLQLDVRFPRTIALIAGARAAAPVERGRMVAGRAVASSPKPARLPAPVTPNGGLRLLESKHEDSDEDAAAHDPISRGEADRTRRRSGGLRGAGGRP